MDGSVKAGHYSTVIHIKAGPVASTRPPERKQAGTFTGFRSASPRRTAKASLKVPSLDATSLISSTAPPPAVPSLKDEVRSPEELARVFLQTIVQSDAAHAAAVYLRDEQTREVGRLAISGRATPAAIQDWEQLVEQVMRTGRPAERPGLLALPLKRPTLEGVLVVQGLRRRGHKVGKNKQLLESIADRLADGLNYARLARKYVQKVERIQRLEAVSEILNSPLEEREVLRRALETATRLVEAEAGSLLLLSGDNGKLIIEVAVGMQAERLKGVRIQAREGIAGLVVQTGQALVVNDAQRDRRVNRTLERQTGLRVRTLLAVPVRARNKILGVLVAMNKQEGRAFSNWDLAEFSSLSNQVAITLENARLLQAYQTKIKRLQKMQEISAVLNSTLDQAEIRKRAIEAATVLMEAEAGSLLLLDEEAGELYFEVALGEKGEGVREIRLKLGEGIAGHVAQSGEPVISNDVQQDPRFSRVADKRSGFITRNMVCVPVKARDKLLGVLQAINKTGGRLFDQEDLQDCVSLGHQVGIAIENANLYQEINRLFEGFISASVTAIESRDPTTSGHSARVALLTCALAEVVDRTDRGPFAAVTFTPDQMKELRYAAVLHDFGKVGVRENILVKAQKLFPGDLALLKARFDFIKRTWEVQALRKKVDLLMSGDRAAAAALLAEVDEELARRIQEADGILEFLLACNQPTVLPEGGFERLHEIANLRYDYFGELRPYLMPQEVIALSIPKGSLTAEERVEIENHVTHTYRFLSTIPWSKSLKNVPLIAYGHHEKLDGTGYPRQVPGEVIPLQTRMMTISDIYDALTASDRPYKAAVPPVQALEILKTEVKQGKLDADLFELFVDAKIYLRARGS